MAQRRRCQSCQKVWNKEPRGQPEFAAQTAFDRATNQ